MNKEKSSGTVKKESTKTNPDQSWDLEDDVHVEEEKTNQSK